MSDSDQRIVDRWTGKSPEEVIAILEERLATAHRDRAASDQRWSAEMSGVVRHFEHSIRAALDHLEAGETGRAADVLIPLSGEFDCRSVAQ